MIKTLLLLAVAAFLIRALPVGPRSSRPSRVSSGGTDDGRSFEMTRCGECGRFVLPRGPAGRSTCPECGRPTG